MKKLAWPEFPNNQYYSCAVCSSIVGSEKYVDFDGNIWYMPESRYWFVETKEVYCGPEHAHSKVCTICNSSNKI
jgi:hypothetical protein